MLVEEVPASITCVISDVLNTLRNQVFPVPNPGVWLRVINILLIFHVAFDPANPLLFVGSHRLQCLLTGAVKLHIVVMGAIPTSKIDTKLTKEICG